ncbi:MAG: copper resistance protein NlpE N-terminal domain-containing protein [Muribaculaceae bacterium]|nr:copper resistance protein NlpE N-terminal domain-containing protein [Muribaculaceae bacterium]
MKKVLFLMLAVAASLGIASCDNSGAKAQANAGNGKGGDKSVLYTGILPAADVQGILYTVKLDFDDDHNYTDGDFVMVENYLAYDSVAASGLRDAATAYSEGDFYKESKVVNGQKVDYLRLVPDAKDGLGVADSAPTYFVMNADGSITLTTQDLTVSTVPGLNYTLTEVK